MKEDGHRLPPHLEVERDETLKRLDTPPPPDGLVYLMGWYRELILQRQPAMSGVAALSYQEIDAWSRLMARPITPSEVHVLATLDRLERATHATANGDDS